MSISGGTDVYKRQVQQHILDAVGHVVDLPGQAHDVLPVDGGDELLDQLGHHLVLGQVALMLQGCLLYTSGRPWLGRSAGRARPAG